MVSSHDRNLQYARYGQCCESERTRCRGMNVGECFIVAVVKHFQKRGIEKLLFRINRRFVNSDGLEVRDPLMLV